jgi:hypothetical protein
MDQNLSLETAFCGNEKDMPIMAAGLDNGPSFEMEPIAGRVAYVFEIEGPADCELLPLALISIEVIEGTDRSGSENDCYRMYISSHVLYEHQVNAFLRDDL